MRPTRGCLLLAGLGVGLLASAPAWAEVTTLPTLAPADDGALARPLHDAPLRAQCWQEGVKIIDRDDLQGLSLNAVTKKNAVSFKRHRDANPSVFLLPFADAICLIQPR